MKHFIFAIALAAASVTTAVAGNGITKSSNDAAIVSGHQAFAGKVTLLQSSLANNNMSAAQTAANDILKLMDDGMAQGRARRDLESTAANKVAANKRYLSMETARFDYIQLMTNLAANGTQMVAKANDFLSNY